MALRTTPWTEGVASSFDSTNRIDFPATGSAPGKQHASQWRRFLRGQEWDGAGMEQSQRSQLASGGALWVGSELLPPFPWTSSQWHHNNDRDNSNFMAMKTNSITVLLICFVHFLPPLECPSNDSDMLNCCYLLSFFLSPSLALWCLIRYPQDSRIQHS